MQTISIISLKGGVAKTTTAVNMAYTLAAVHSKKVLIIDNDKQGNTSKAFKKYDTEDKNTVARIQKSTSGSIVRYQKNKVDKPDEDQLLEDRIASYNRSKNDVERIEKALKKIEGKKGYEVIEMRYLQRKKTVENGKQVEEVYTFEEIADILGGQQGYNENLNEKTVRNYKNALVRDMAIFLFGSDAV